MVSSEWAKREEDRPLNCHQGGVPWLWTWGTLSVASAPCVVLLDLWPPLCPLHLDQPARSSRAPQLQALALGTWLTPLFKRHYLLLQLYYESDSAVVRKAYVVFN